MRTVMKDKCTWSTLNVQDTGKCMLVLIYNHAWADAYHAIQSAYVAFPCRNQRLFRCVFWSCCCIQSTVSLNSTHIHTSTKHIWTPLLSSAIRSFECSDAIKMCDGITFKFLHGTVTNSILTCVISVTVECLVWRWLPGFMLWQWSSYTTVPQETDGWRWASKPGFLLRLHVIKAVFGVLLYKLLFVTDMLHPLYHNKTSCDCLSWVVAV